MGKILDIILGIIVILGAIYVFTRMGVTLGDLVHDIKVFIHGPVQGLLPHVICKIYCITRQG